MNNSDTSHKEILVGTKPLFASPWLALFFELRKNYNERNDRATTNKPSEPKLN